MISQLEEAEACVHDGRLVDAELAYARVLEKTPEDATALFGLASVLTSLGRRGDALHLLRRALQIDPANKSVRRNFLPPTEEAAGQTTEMMSELLPGFSLPPSMNPDARRFLDQCAAPHLTSVFHGDNLITFQKSLGFMRDASFVGAIERNAPSLDERSRIWRIHTLVWAARNALNLPGDYVELGVLRGFMSGCVIDCLDFGKLDRRFFLYDTFSGLATFDPEDHARPFFDDLQRQYSHSDNYQHVCRLFAALSNVIVVKGAVPESLKELAPEHVCYIHVDMNSSKPEAAALDFFWERLVPGAFIVLDDYGWSAFEQQRRTHDAFFASKKLRVLELPTGQGLVVKPPEST
jgi:hypothetical protein